MQNANLEFQIEFYSIVYDYIMLQKYILFTVFKYIHIHDHPLISEYHDNSPQWSYFFYISVRIYLVKLLAIFPIQLFDLRHCMVRRQFGYIWEITLEQGRNCREMRALIEGNKERANKNKKRMEIKNRMKWAKYNTYNLVCEEHYNYIKASSYTIFWLLHFKQITKFNAFKVNIIHAWIN